MIEDERGLVTINQFRKMFFTYFKGETSAYQVYDMLEPAVSVHYDLGKNCLLDNKDPRATSSNKFIRI